MGSLKLWPISLISTSLSTRFDEAGNQIIDTASVSAGSPPYANPPLHLQPPTSHSEVPPLVYYCIAAYVKRLSYNMRQNIIDQPGVSRPYDPPPEGKRDLFNYLIPHMHPSSKAVRWKYVDPRLWLTLIRMYWPESLPETFFEYPMALADPFLPYTQHIEPTDHFSLVTILNLASQPELTDETVTSLRSLHQLVALDTSWTKVTNLGIKKFAGSLRWDEDFETPRGPWKLRAWCLRGCKVDDKVSNSLRCFPLLSIVDLRSTLCTRCPHLHKWTSLLPAEDYPELFHPTPIQDQLDGLNDLATSHDTQLFSTPHKPFSIYVDTLSYPPTPTVRLEINERSMTSNNPTAFPAEGGYLMLGSNGSRVQGSVLVRENKVLAEEKRLRQAELKWKKKHGEEMPPEVKDDLSRPQLQPLGPLAVTLPVREVPELDQETEQERLIRVADERQEALQDAQRLANRDWNERIQGRERQAAKRLQRQTIEKSRDPTWKMAPFDILNRSLMLLRIPPPYSDLRTAVDQHRESLAKIALLKEEKKRAAAETVAAEQSALVDKRRKVADNDMWKQIAGTVGKAAPAKRPPTRLANISRTRNPFGSQA